jgi:hypothetical protein
MLVFVPFTAEEFFEVFARYNDTVWPAQLLFYAVGILATVLAVRRHGQSSRMITLILAALWLWMGIVYHIGFFAEINKFAIVFGLLFAVQAALLFWIGVWKRKLIFRARPNVGGLVGTLFVLYALVIYPALGAFLGHRYPAVPTFGLPCPTTIFTLGLLCWTDRDIPLSVVIIPLIWSGIGFFAAVQLNVPQDIGLLVAGVISIIFLLACNKNSEQSASNGV